MTTLKFKAGDDVPEYILKPEPDSDPIKSIIFVLDAEAAFLHGMWYVWPTEPLDGRQFVFVQPAIPNACVRLTGGPTNWHQHPVNDYQKHALQSWAESKAAMPVNYGDKAADPYAVSLPDNAVWYRGLE